MKMTRKDVRRRTKLLFVIPFLVFLAAGVALAQDITITNLAQFAQEAFSADHCLYLPFMPWQWQAYSNYGGVPWWLDCSQLSCGALFQGPTNLGAGVPAYDAVLTKNILTGEITLQAGGSTDIVARIAAPGGYQPGQLSSQDVWVLREWQQATNCPDCWGIEGEMPPPTVTLKALLADINDYAAYESNLEATAEAEALSSTASRFSTGGEFMALAEDESGDGPLDLGASCIITSPAQPFVILSVSQNATNGASIVFESCTNYIYGILSADVLPSTNWIGRASMWGQPNTTSWTDASATNLTARFFKVVRMDPSGDFDGDGLPNWWEVQYGLNPLDSGDAINDFDNDGYSNFDEFLMGTGVTSSNSPITVYVDSTNTNGVWDGTQAHPFRYIQDAMQCSVSVNSNLAIRVRPGDYYETVSNLQFDFDGYVLSKRNFVYLYAANSDWSLSTDPETHLIDSSGLPNGDMLGNSDASLAPAVQFYDVTRARLNGFKIHNGWGVNAGGIECISTQGVVTVSNCIIEKNGNPNTTLAGGILLWALPGSLVYNTVIAKNVGQVGGILDFNGSQIWNSTIVSNTETASGVGGIYGYFAFPNVRNCVAWGNGLDLYAVDVDYSVVGSNEFVTAGEHNLTSDPILVTTPFGNYRLQTDSPIRGAGISLPIEQRDLYGNGRPASGSFDIGANQYKDTDGDGMQDDWETKHGLSPGGGGDATGNPDGDGFNNRDEYNQNTDPHNSDTDGDGFQDDQDPDPTVPDEVLTIEFHSFYRDAVWQYYINGVTDPTWINQPPTQPRVIKLKNYHIGDELSLQMRYLSGPLDTLLFLVPLQSKGAFAVMPAADDTPVGQFTSSAPLGDLTPPAPGWPVVVWQATPTNPEVCQGFDDESLQFRFYGQPRPAASVPQSGANTFNMPVNAGNFYTQVVFQIADTSLATVTPQNASAAATQTVSVSSAFVGNVITSTTLTVVGPGAQNSYAPTASTTDIDILPKRTNVTVAVYVVTAQGEPSTAPTNVPSQADLKAYLDSVFGKQANVFFNVLPPTNIVVNYDVSPSNGVLNLLRVGISAEAAAITNLASIGSAPNVINVYYVNSLSVSNVVGLVSGATYATRRITFIQDFHLNTNVNVTAHEIGHEMLLQGEVPTDWPGNNDRLMWWQSLSSDPCRLIRREWKTSNQNAQ